MKKLISALLAVALLLAMSTTAFAATVSEDGGSQTVDVNAKYVDSVTGAKKYSVDLQWGGMQFTYTVTGTKAWNAQTHQYDPVSSSGAWTATGNEITVTNHSNTNITADFRFDPLSSYQVTASFSNPSIALPTAEGKSTSDASLTGKTTVTLGGTLADSVTSMTKVGTVTITIS